jgi:hypothetical protein
MVGSASDALEASIEAGATPVDVSLSPDPEKAVLTLMKSRRAAAKATECILCNEKDLISISLYVKYDDASISRGDDSAISLILTISRHPTVVNMLWDNVTHDFN